jgi:hypothetical protein
MLVQLPGFIGIDSYFTVKRFAATAAPGFPRDEHAGLRTCLFVKNETPLKISLPAFYSLHLRRYGSAAATWLLRIKRESGVNPELSRSCKKFNERETVLSAIPLYPKKVWEGSRAGLRARRPAITHCMRGFRGKGRKQIPQASALHDFRFSFSRAFQLIVIFF